MTTGYRQCSSVYDWLSMSGAYCVSHLCEVLLVRCSSHSVSVYVSEVVTKVPYIQPRGAHVNRVWRPGEHLNRSCVKPGGNILLSRACKPGEHLNR